MPPRKQKPEQQLFVNHLLEAVRFVSAAQRSKGDEMATHCIVRYGQIIAFDRSIAAGAVIAEDDLNCCPQTELLRLALERCGQEHSIVQGADSLFVRSGEFSAYVPLCDPAKLTIAVPDPACAPLGDEFRASLMVTATLAKESAQTVLQSCIQLNPRSTIATNGTVIMEAWHGYDMPPGLLISKSFADAVIKAKKHIVSFGFSPATFTVHFDDRSWMRTNLFTEKIPDMLSRLKAFDAAPACRSFPENFFASVNTIGKWSSDERVYFYDQMISSHPPSVELRGGVERYSMPSMFQGVSYSIASLKLIAKHARMFNGSLMPNATIFFGDKVRGVIAHWLIVEPNKCLRCGCETRDGICQNYGCEIPSERRIEHAHPTKDNKCSHCGHDYLATGENICDCDIPF